MARAIVCAYSPVGREALEGLLEAGVHVTALYTYPHAPEDAWFDPPESVARREGIPVRYAPDFNAEEVYQTLVAEAPDFLFSFYFREMIQARFLELPRLGAYNLHGSLLPRYRGRAPINWVLVKGETQTGVTLHAMTPKPDDGDIIAQTPLDIAWDETPLSLTQRAAEVGRALVREIVPQLVAGTAPRLSQKTLGPSSYFGGRKPQDSRLDPSMTVAEAFNQIRAVADPWPNAFLATEQGSVNVSWALPTAQACPQGSVRVTREGVLLGFADGALRLVALKRDGVRTERPTEQASWLQAMGFSVVDATQE